MEYLSFSKYLKDKFGQKVYKISLDGGFTCPNRDGKAGTRGCIFLLQRRKRRFCREQRNEHNRAN